MRLGSFCTGYGGLDMAVEAHYGAHLAWCSEVDKDCNQLLAHHWPGVPNLGDLTKVDWDQVEPVDIMCAGFPCQPFSHAGKRLGGDDERAIFAYIADAVGVLRPGIVVLENVAGLLTLGGPGVVGTLTGLGYDLQWGVVRASDAGAPHRRARWFCIARNAHTDGRPRWAAVGRVPTGPHAHSGRTGGATTDTDSVAGAKVIPGDRRPGEVARPGTVERTLRPDSGAATDTDSERLEGHGEPERNRAGRRQPPTPGDSTSCDWSMFTPAITRWEGILGRPAPDPVTDGKLSSRFVSWMMGLPENWVCGLGLSRNAELKMLGNGVCVQQAALGLEILDDQR